MGAGQIVSSPATHVWPILIRGSCIPATYILRRLLHASMGHTSSECCVQQALKQQCAAEVEAVQQEVQHKQRQAARMLKAKAEEEAIKVIPHM